MKRNFPISALKPCVAGALSFLLVALSPGWTVYQAAAQTVARVSMGQGLGGQMAGIGGLNQGSNPALLQGGSMDLRLDVLNALQSVENVRIGGHIGSAAAHPGLGDALNPDFVTHRRADSSGQDVPKGIHAVSGKVASVLKNAGSIAESKGETAHGVGEELNSILTRSPEEKNVGNVALVPADAADSDKAAGYKLQKPVVGGSLDRAELTRLIRDSFVTEQRLSAEEIREIINSLQISLHAMYARENAPIVLYPDLPGEESVAEELAARLWVGAGILVKDARAVVAGLIRWLRERDGGGEPGATRPIPFLDTGVFEYAGPAGGRVISYRVSPDMPRAIPSKQANAPGGRSGALVLDMRRPLSISLVAAFHLAAVWLSSPFLGALFASPLNMGPYRSLRNGWKTGDVQSLRAIRGHFLGMFSGNLAGGLAGLFVPLYWSGWLLTFPMLVAAVISVALPFLMVFLTTSLISRS